MILTSNYPELRDDFFANIASFVPKLKSLRIGTRKQYSDSFINSFYSMKNIQRVSLIGNNTPIKSYTKYWYFGKCLTFRKMIFGPNGKYIIKINDNCGFSNWFINPL